jgi:D-arabinose 1-dehydrogenase-like Zn-dependent alcohol dehydrogenase
VRAILVGIQGIGGLGHLGVQFARRMGFRTVAINNGPEKAALAKELGAWKHASDGMHASLVLILSPWHSECSLGG